MHPKDAHLHSQLGKLLFYHKGDAKTGLLEMRKAISLGAKDPSNYYLLGEMYRVRGEGAHAVESYMTASELAKRSASGRELSAIYDYSAACLLRRMGNLPQAERLYEQALAELHAYTELFVMTDASKSRCPRKYWNALEHDMLSELDKAKSILVRRRPDTRWIHRQLPSVDLPAASDRSKAIVKIAKLERAIRNGAIGGNGPHARLGNLYIRAGLPGRAVVEFLTVIEWDRRDSSAWYQLGYAYLLEGRLDESASAFKRADSLGYGSGQLAVCVQAAAERFRQSNPNL